MAALSAATVLLVATACGIPGGSDGSAAPAPSRAENRSEIVPAGHGTLRQDDVTITLRRADLQIKVTPLADPVIRLTAPDTHERLRGLRQGRGPELVRQTGLPDPALFLVTFFSYEPDVSFEPEDVHLLNRGLRHRPLAIGPVTPGWGTQRLAQEETRMAVYAYEPVDLEQDLAVEYQGVRQAGWQQILSALEAERARALARSRSSENR